MKHNKLVNLAVTVLICLASNTIHSANNTQRDQVETLFRLTQMEKKIQESVDSVVQLQIRQNPQLEQHKKTLHEFFNKHIGWNALKNDIAKMYMERFTEKELEEINAFYITPAGQKIINELPQLVQQRNQLSMMRIEKNISELQQIIGPQKTGQ
jgi:hypothetical protein